MDGENGVSGSTGAARRAAARAGGQLKLCSHVWGDGRRRSDDHGWFARDHRQRWLHVASGGEGRGDARGRVQEGGSGSANLLRGEFGGPRSSQLANRADEAMSDVASSLAPNGAPEAAPEWASAHPDLRRAAYDLRAESRARTIHAALQKLDLLPASQTTLRIHVLGANFRESADPALAFAPLLALLEGSDLEHLELLLCGPNCCLEEPEADAAAKPSAPAAAARESWWRSLLMSRLRAASPPPAPAAPAPPRCA